MPISAADLIRQFDLQPHPEGGYFRETYRAADTIVRPSDDARRAASTAIYYLLCDGAYSSWHRIRSDEVWHFYAGDPLEVWVLDERDGLTIHRLGNPLVHPGTVFQAVVPAGRWFGARCVSPEQVAFVGCTVAPGFEFAEFELADAEALAEAFPEYAEHVAQLAPRAPG
ncbi:cupin domain-containing protein [Burkholderia sp. BC1]|uniref:cupin domain-containing protein n=1 Tax=Burkholderia sp. BC1 TaxID=1095370 RepID=UPI0040451252|nr:cupin domain-containing protein [Burkholderia multivorans]